MRTIAVFHAGSDEAEALWYCELDDLGGKPAKGDSFIYAHNAYEVVKTHVCLGSRDAKGVLRSGTDKLLEVLNTLFGTSKALGLYARLNNIGSGDAPSTTSGGLIMPQASLAGDFDNVVFCTVKAVRTGGGSDRDFSGLLRAAAKLTASGAADVSDLPAAGLARIRLEKPSSGSGGKGGRAASRKASGSK